ncbi:YoaK family protein [Rhizobium sp. YIM 134829]|uniref:YoaK family protein n=1 Tax=Rhizobium sp. YIM 134829 TaxID=3390453 RepID=UPI00397A1D66
MLGSSLALVAGGVNSAGYLAFQFFSANMTGNVSLASDFLAVGHLAVALAFLTVVSLFILGAVLASVLIEWGKRRGWGSIYALTLAGEAAILIAVSLSSAVSTVAPDPVLTVGALALAMGMQNAASSRISANRVRTTHVSGAATDMGIELALLMMPGTDPRKSGLRFGLALHLATILCFALGGILGVIGHHYLGGATFAGFAVPLLGLSGWYAVRLRKGRRR